MSSCSSIKSPQSTIDLEYVKSKATQYYEDYSHIDYASKEDSIYITGGLTTIQDKLIQEALNSLGTKFITLESPTFESFQLGKVYGNKAQCNPTYFTVGNLIKYLIHLRDVEGVSSEEIVRRYVYVTAGGCGPCRFGMYITEYKKALKDAGFAGLRITSFEHDRGIFQGDDIEDNIIDFTPKFFITLAKAAIIGDLINLIAHQKRPYEVNKGDTNKAVDRSIDIISQAFLSHSSLLVALYKVRKELDSIKVDKSIKKPKVLISGEFWAAMTQGDGNYNLHQFLEEQGAESIPQPVINRLLLSIWEVEFAFNQKADLEDSYKDGFNLQQVKTKLMLKLAKIAVKLHIKIYSKFLNLDYDIPDIEYLASLAKEYYPLECSGGEGHLEVAHLLESIKHNLADMVISIKPFGCMPSSAVSDGIQSLVLSHYPEANFLSIETSGEGAANFYSRIQMALFKAKEKVKLENSNTYAISLE